MVFIYVTFPDRMTAKQIAQAAIEQRLAACANIFNDHESIYRWKEKIEHSIECVAIFKTTSEKSNALSDFIASQHPFDTPCIASLNVEKLNSKFAAWVKKATEEEKPYPP